MVEICYVCKNSYVDFDTKYMRCFIDGMYVQPCSTCEHFKHDRLIERKNCEENGYVEQHEEIEVKSNKMNEEESNVCKQNDNNEWGNSERYNKYTFECIEEMEKIFGIDDVIAFCKCNAWKYRYRATCEEDLQKADFYMKKLDELLKKRNK